MAPKENANLNTLPVGRLGILPLQSCTSLGQKVDNYLVRWRKERQNELKSTIAFEGYERDSYIIASSTPRFGSGEAKGVINESIRGDDLYIMVDVCNYSLTYSLCGYTNRMSPDDHFQDLKRIIAAVGGKARRVNVIMPFLYESRQHRRSGRESLDCAIALKELLNMGVENIITFDAHDPRVQNAIPLHGFETVRPTYQFLKGLFRVEPDLPLDSGHLMVISPDAGGTERAIYLANVLGVDMGMFYKRRDYAHIVDGRNPIVAHEFLGADVKGKNMIIIDDMISSGDSMLCLLYTSIWVLSLKGWYCVNTPTVSTPELIQLLSGKSIILYFPPNATAGFATFAVKTPSLLPCPPASSIAIISFLIMQSPLVLYMISLLYHKSRN